jgi:hypothetical protein
MMKRSLGRRSRSYWGIRVALVVIAVAMRAATSAAQEDSPAADVMRRFGLDEDQIAQVCVRVCVRVSPTPSTSPTHTHTMEYTQ